MMTTTTNELREAGFILTPLRENRLPFSGWRNTQHAQFSDSELGNCYGCVLREDDLVLDYDPRRNVGNENQLQILFAQLGIETPVQTYIVATGGVYDQGQGYHVYFKKPADFPVRGGTIPGFPSIEIKTAGRYVVAEGARHEHGRVYKRFRGSPMGVLHAPESLLNACRAPETVTPVRNDARLEDNSQHARTRFVDYIVNKGGHEQGAYVIANFGKDIGLPADTIVELMLEYCNAFWVNDPITEEQARERVNHAFQYGQNSQGSRSLQNEYAAEIQEIRERNEQNQNGFLTHTGFDFDQRGALLPTLRNCISYLLLPTFHNTQQQEVDNPLHGALRYNLFSHNIEFTKRAPWHMPGEPHPHWIDDDTILLKAWWLQNTALYNVPVQVIEEAIVAVAHTHHYHPIREWLASLKWDGKPRLDRWLITYAGCKDDPYVREVGRLTLLAAVARVMRPGCKHDTMLILEGKQDLGKSRLVKAIGGKWFADVAIDPHNRDCVDAMQGAWILEASELEFMRRAEVNALKRFISLQTDKVRLAYKRRAQELPRQNIFIGTVNPPPEGYLTDQTGNRRYLPVRCGKIDVEAFKADRDQIFAEAYARFNDGEKWFTTDAGLKNLAVAQQRKRESYLEWSQTVAMWLEDCADMLPPILTTSAIASQCLGIPVNKHNSPTIMREVCRAIREAGLVESWVYSTKHKRSVRAWVKQHAPAISYNGLEGL